METIIFFGIIGVCLTVVLVIFCMLVYHLNKQIKKTSRELKRLIKIEHLKQEKAKLFYNAKTGIYTDENGREILELRGTPPTGTPPSADNNIIPVYITDKN